MRRACLLVVLAVLGLAPAAAAAGPHIQIELAGGGYERRVTVEVAKGSRPVRGATVYVTALMRHPGHAMSVAPRRARELRPGVYRARLSFPMLGEWRLTATVNGTRRTIVARL